MLKVLICFESFEDREKRIQMADKRKLAEVINAAETSGDPDRKDE